MRERQFQFKVTRAEGGAAFPVRVVPRPSKNEIAEILSEGTIKVRLSAPPVDNEANEALIVFMSDVLGVPKSRLEIVAGAAGRDKLISVLDMDAETAHKRVLAYLG